MKAQWLYLMDCGASLYPSPSSIVPRQLIIDRPPSWIVRRLRSEQLSPGLDASTLNLDAASMRASMRPRCGLDAASMLASTPASTASTPGRRDWVSLRASGVKAASTPASTPRRPPRRLDARLDAELASTPRRIADALDASTPRRCLDASTPARRQISTIDVYSSGEAVTHGEMIDFEAYG